jgi:hypothetical protein
VTIETDLQALLSPLVGGEVYPDVGIDPVLPYITYQQVGGESISFMEATVPSKRNGRFQVNTWADNRLQASALMRQAADLLITTATLQATALGEPIATYDDETKRYGARQDFSVWFAA